eukprot:TRINITY_DN12140_c0_g1_i1.p1 TRINITY_DN12140_c0_g1~~TRINITY_DN12140_c0_g1_i1.p1  ORF type:complete len:196 (+),score=62.14 TRINITY_DN12140_c0_g1_i1:132-719(+)
MNIQQFNLDEIELQPSELKEVLRCVLHSIMFTRAFGLVRPADASVDFLDLHYARCDNEEIERYIEDRLQDFHDSWQRRNFEPSHRSLILSFDERRTKTRWLAKVEENVRWEQWVLNIFVNKSTKLLPERKDRLNKDLRRLLFDVIRIVNEYKNHIPPITKPDIAPFPYEISFSGLDSGASSGIFATLGSMLKSTT